MSAESFQDSGNEEFEAATGDDIRVLVALAESALEQGQEALESSYYYACLYGHVMFKTRTVVDEYGDRLIESRFRVYSPEDEQGEASLLLEYAYAPGGATMEDYIVGDDGDSTDLESYAVRCEIGDICRTILLDKELDEDERYILTYFKQLVAAADADDAPTEAEEAVLGDAIVRAVLAKDGIAEHVNVREFDATIENVGTLDVTGYELVQSSDEDATYPCYEVELNERSTGILTTFAMPNEGEGEPTLYRETPGGEIVSELDDDLPPAKKHIELLSQHLAAALTDAQLLELQEEADEPPYEDEDPLHEVANITTLYFNLVAEAEAGSPQHEAFKERALENYQVFRNDFETRYHLHPDALDMNSEQFAQELALFIIGARNLMQVSVPFIHASNAKGKYEIIEFDEDQVVNFHYVEAVLCEIDDEKEVLMYRGIGLFGFVEVEEPFINNPGSGQLPKKHLHPATIPLVPATIMTPSGSTYN